LTCRRSASRSARRGRATRPPRGETGEGLDDRHVHDLPDLLAPGDVLVLNDTKVIPAELHGERIRATARHPSR
jgi:S-adenosylmethionine:tRNA ribosyltransferase-isomerase